MNVTQEISNSKLVKILLKSSVVWDFIQFRNRSILSNETKQILYLSPTRNGRKHDFNITKAENIPNIIPPDKELYADTGFQGIKNLVKSAKNIIMPRKRSKNNPSYAFLSN